MMQLETLEQRFLAHVRSGEAFPREWCAQGIVASDVGLSIYANAYHSRLREALETDHPALSNYLGDELWAEFCTGYIEAHPSSYRTLRLFGQHVPEYLRARAPFAAHPLLAELAAFERELLDVFDAADAPRLGWAEVQQLEALAWPSLRLQFHPSVRLLPTATNAVEVWRALKDKLEPPQPNAATTLARLLWRDAERVSRFRPVNADELLALQTCLLDGNDFAAICERLAHVHPPGEVPAIAIRILRQWFDEGIVGGIDSPTDCAIG